MLNSFSRQPSAFNILLCTFDSFDLLPNQALGNIEDRFAYHLVGHAGKDLPDDVLDGVFRHSRGPDGRCGNTAPLLGRQ
jgi:hypothetical protein